MTTCNPAAAFLTESAVQAIATGGFPEWWAAFWERNGGADVCDADRAWLEDNGRRLLEALRGGGRAPDELLSELQGDLATEIWFGPRRKAATFFADWVGDLRSLRALQAESIGLGRRASPFQCEGVDLADALLAIFAPSETIRLAELLAGAPTRH